ncbi:MAG: hypothetical protein ABIF01_02295 [Candidatus Micrarchaeota archaeon]
MRAQVAIEYVFAVFMWLFVCTAVSYAISPYISALASQSSLRAYSSQSAWLGGIGSSDVDGLRFAYRHTRVDGNLSFNNTSVVLATKGDESIADYAANYSYSDLIERGDKVLLRIQDGTQVAVKVE